MFIYQELLDGFENQWVHRLNIQTPLKLICKPITVFSEFRARAFSYVIAPSILIKYIFI